MKCQALCPSKDKSKKIKVSSAAISVWPFLCKLRLLMKDSNNFSLSDPVALILVGTSISLHKNRNHNSV